MILRDGRRLHKQRIACRRFIDHRTAYFKLILFFHRDAEVSVTYGAEAVRHTFLIRPHDRFRLLFHPFLRSFHISSKRLQQLGRHIVHSAVSNLHLELSESRLLTKLRETTQARLLIEKGGNPPLAPSLSSVPSFFPYLFEASPTA